ncbi:MAG TPA: 50S ribosomal protein L19 [Candidatus Saccharimonadales bacterium]|nr:50S ribosomal protein L19 [Candidatus Saccharimonadales bacterium]
MDSVVRKIEKQFMKSAVVDVRSGDTVKVHQKIREGNKERVQIFQGLVIRTNKKGSHMNRITVRRIASGIGVEKSFLMHSPLVLKVEVTKRSKVRRNYLTYMRERTGKAARLTGVEFDHNKVNTVRDEAAEAAEAKLKEETAKAAEAEAAKKAEEEAKLEAKAQAALAAHEMPPAKNQTLKNKTLTFSEHCTLRMCCLN